jgi:drug/metabolite transporter (DMT)-like permease
MGWLAFSTIAYFIIALEVILDKFLLSSKRISHPVIYAFYSGILSSFALVFLFPFGWHMIGFLYLISAIAAGIIFAYGILALFYSIEKGEASRVTTVVGAVVPTVAYFLSLVILREILPGAKIMGVAALIAGGILISLELGKKRKRIFFPGFYEAILAGVLLALAYTLFKKFYGGDNFINVFIWTRLGVFIGALSFLFFPGWRRAIFNSLSKFKRPSGNHKTSGLLFVFTKCLGGVGSIILQYAFSLGSVTIINALISIEYTFVFLLGIGFTFWRPEIFSEKIDKKSLLQKIAAIIIVAAGVMLVSLK